MAGGIRGGCAHRFSKVPLSLCLTLSLSLSLSLSRTHTLKTSFFVPVLAIRKRRARLYRHIPRLEDRIIQHFISTMFNHDRLRLSSAHRPDRSFRRAARICSPARQDRRGGRSAHNSQHHDKNCSAGAQPRRLRHTFRHCAQSVPTETTGQTSRLARRALRRGPRRRVRARAARLVKSRGSERKLDFIFFFRDRHWEGLGGPFGIRVRGTGIHWPGTHWQASSCQWFGRGDKEAS